MTENGYSLADIAAATGGGGNNNDGMFGNNGWWIILLFLAWGGRGFGFGGGGGGNGGVGTGSVCATPADVTTAVDRQTFISKLDQQTYGLADATYALNNAITGGFAAAELSRANMAMDNQKCCCETQRLIERGFCDTNNSIHLAARDIVDNANANSRAILDFLVKDKIDTLTAENQTLKFAASQSAQNAFFTANQEAQTAELIRRLGRDNPVPAYVVPNPNCCYQYNVTPACGCGCGGAF
ncbi:MAG: hypothetical protein J6Q10_01230 [Clostridia bacterium]|nr:hypothetical protein [Clostridia bacterium]